MESALRCCRRDDREGVVALHADGLVAAAAVGRRLGELVAHFYNFVASGRVVTESDKDGAEMIFAEAGDDVHNGLPRCLLRVRRNVRGEMGHLDRLITSLSDDHAVIIPSATA